MLYALFARRLTFEPSWSFHSHAPLPADGLARRSGAVPSLGAGLVAAKLAHTCYRMYADQRTGLAPEFVRFGGGRMLIGAAHNLLRPEAIESMFYMWRFTKDPKYREWGWKMFLAFEKNCRVPNGGYAALKRVDNPNSPKDDKMETFWLAESLKYFLMLFSDDELLNLETHVLNTEAHPLRVLSE